MQKYVGHIMQNISGPKTDSVHSYIAIFKPGARRGRCAPGFLELFLCGCLYVCVFVCVFAPEAINN